MKSIPFKTNPKYALKYPPKSLDNIGAGLLPYPSRHLQRTFIGEEQPGEGISKETVFLMEKGTTVIHRSEKRKWIKKEIREVFGSAITSSKRPTAGDRNVSLKARKNLKSK